MNNCCIFRAVSRYPCRTEVRRVRAVTVCRRGQVADLKRALSHQQARQKMRRPRSSCLRAEQQLVERVRRGRGVAADTDSDSEQEQEQEQRRRPRRRAKRSSTAQPLTPPAEKRNCTRAEPTSPYIR